MWVVQRVCHCWERRHEVVEGEVSGVRKRVRRAVVRATRRRWDRKARIMDGETGVLWGFRWRLREWLGLGLGLFVRR